MTSTFILVRDQAVPLDRVTRFRIYTTPSEPVTHYLAATVRGERFVDESVIASDSHDHGGLRAWLTEVAADPHGPFLTLPTPALRVSY